MELTYPNPGAVTLRSWNGSVATILFIVLVEVNASALVGSIVKIGGKVGCTEVAIYTFGEHSPYTSTLHFKPPPCRAIDYPRGIQRRLSDDSQPGSFKTSLLSGTSNPCLLYVTRQARLGAAKCYSGSLYNGVLSLL